MHTCIICHFPTELDDVVIPTAGGRCLCLRCYSRVTGSERSIPRALRHAISTVLVAVEPAER